jgi:hypothetical protein
VHRFLCLLLFTSACATAMPSPRQPAPLSAGASDLVPILLLEAAPGAPAEGLPLLRAIPEGDPRRAEGERLIDNEPARFIRRLIAHAYRRFGAARAATLRMPGTAGATPVLPILLRDGGNHAKRGFRLITATGVEEHGDAPYIVLQLAADSLSHTLLHEGGHVVDMIARQGRRPEPTWSPLAHSTFATTDPLTALAEGYAIHLETLWAHYGAAPGRRAFYQRLAPGFDAAGLGGEFFAPVKDLMTFAQNWARYQAVREGLPAFAGVRFPGDYLRSQYDPARDRATLKTASGMIASEGVVASVLFWISVAWAEEAMARPGGGLDQPGLLAAEERIAAALAEAGRGAQGPARPDLVDVVVATGTSSAMARRQAVVRFVDITRGVTARPSLRAQWSALYRAAATVDVQRARTLAQQLDLARGEIVAAALRDPATLRRGLGPMVPVRASGRSLQLIALGESFPLEFDLNTALDAELDAISVNDARLRERFFEERERAPFRSLADLEQRLGVTAAKLGLEAVP